MIGALLNITLQGKQSISEAKVAIYEQHKRDLIFLKYFIRKYCRKDYSKVFRDATKDNYVAYSGNVKKLQGSRSGSHALTKCILRFCEKACEGHPT